MQALATRYILPQKRVKLAEAPVSFLPLHLMQCHPLIVYRHGMHMAAGEAYSD